MKTTERVLEFLRTQGFCPETALPFIQEVTDDNRDIVLEALNQTNSGVKVAKTSIIDNSVWAFFEIFLDSTPEVKDIIPRALNCLMVTRQTFYENIG